MKDIICTESVLNLYMLDTYDTSFMCAGGFKIISHFGLVWVRMKWGWVQDGWSMVQSPNSGDDSEWHGDYEDSDRPKRKGGKGGKGGAKGGKGGSAGGAGGAGKGKAKGRGGGGNYWRGNWFQDVHFYRSSQLPVPICPCSTNFQSSQVGTSTDDSFYLNLLKPCLMYNEVLKCIE